MPSSDWYPECANYTGHFTCYPHWHEASLNVKDGREYVTLFEREDYALINLEEFRRLKRASNIALARTK